jgi:hypothetical protein
MSFSSPLVSIHVSKTQVMSWSIGKKWKFSFSWTNVQENGGNLFCKDFRKKKNLIFFHCMWPLNRIKIKIVFLVTCWTLFHYLYFSNFLNKHSRNKWWNMWWVFFKKFRKKKLVFSNCMQQSTRSSPFFIIHVSFYLKIKFMLQFT